MSFSSIQGFIIISKSLEVFNINKWKKKFKDLDIKIGKEPDKLIEKYKTIRINVKRIIKNPNISNFIIKKTTEPYLSIYNKEKYYFNSKIEYFL